MHLPYHFGILRMSTFWIYIQIWEKANQIYVKQTNTSKLFFGTDLSIDIFLQLVVVLLQAKYLYSRQLDDGQITDSSITSFKRWMSVVKYAMKEERRVLEPLTFEWRTHISRQCGGRSDISESRNDTLALCAMQYTLRQNHYFCFWLNWKNNLANWQLTFFWIEYICNKNSHIPTYLIPSSLLANKLCYS